MAGDNIYLNNVISFVHDVTIVLNLVHYNQYGNERKMNEIFREAMKEVKPLGANKRVFLKKKLFNRRKFIEDFKQEDTLFFLSDYQTEENVTADERLFFVRPGLQLKQIRNLKRGKISICATLDLHGFNIESARKELIRFLDYAHQNKKYCINIIHGKGHAHQPILKNKLNNWLRQVKIVLAFCTALPKHGGGGATYILLK
jgi:DNA-nicking Smr family endonuclease